MPVTLFALLTAPAAQAAPKLSPFVEMLQSPEKAALFITLVGGAIVTVIVTAVVKIGKARRELAMADADKPVAPMPPAPPAPPALPLPSPATHAAPHDYEAEMHALRIQLVHLEDELLAVQTSARNLRKAHDAGVFENAALSKALYAERSANEELRGKAAALLAEMARLRANGPASLPPLRKLRSVPPPRGGRER